jgi:hypothetical protein
MFYIEAPLSKDKSIKDEQLSALVFQVHMLNVNAQGNPYAITIAENSDLGDFNSLNRIGLVAPNEEMLTLITGQPTQVGSKPFLTFTKPVSFSHDAKKIVLYKNKLLNPKSLLSNSKRKAIKKVNFIKKKDGIDLNINDVQAEIIAKLTLKIKQTPTLNIKVFSATSGRNFTLNIERRDPETIKRSGYDTYGLNAPVPMLPSMCTI